MKEIVKYILLLLLLSFLSAFPQNNITNYNSSDGLSQTEINCITQDSTGFIWIGTQGGLNRFDGRNFITYQHIVEDANSLSNNYIRDLLCEGKFIWVATHGGGLNKLNTITGKSINYNYKLKGSENFDANIITSIIPLPDKRLMLGTEGCGILIFNKKKNSFENYTLSKTSPRKNNVLRLNKWNDSLTNAITEEDVYVFNIRSKSFTSLIVPNNQSVTAVSRINDNQMIVGTQEGELFYVNIINGEFIFTPLGLNCSPIKSILPVDQAHMWISTVGGTLLLSLKQNKFVSPQIMELPDEISNLKIKCIFKDRSNILWIGTTENGIYKLNLKRKYFKSLPLSKSDCINGNSVWCIYKDNKENLWIGTDGCGLIVQNLKTGERKKLIANGKDNSISSNNISSVVQDDEGNYWISTFGGGISVIKTSGEYVHYGHSDKEGSLSHNYVWIIFKAKDGSIWIGSKGGLDLFDKKTSNFINYKNIPNDHNSPSSNSILTIFEDSDHQIWLGTFGGGLNKLDRKGNKFTHYHHDPNDKNTISNNSIMSIYEDIFGNLWLGTDIGLNKLDREKELFTGYFEKNGLANNIVYGVTGDNEGNIWASTNKGISKLSQIKNKFRNYILSDGLLSDEFNQSAVFTAPDGEIFFGGINGVNYFSPKEIKDNPYFPRVAFTSIKIFENEIPLSNIIGNDNTINVSYFDNYLQFVFAALEFTEPKENNYKYILEGFDKNWRYSGTRNTAIYTNLDPGKYTLRVAASNNDGLWNEKGASLTIIVDPPFYMTWWARVLMMFLLAGIVYSLFKIRLKRLMEIEKLRLKIASDLHDEVGAALTSLSIQSQLLPFDKEEGKQTNRLKVIDELCRKVISTMSDIVWSIDSRNDSINDIVNRMKSLSFNLLNDSHVNVFYNVDIEGYNRKLPLDIRQNLYLIFKEAFNNAVKYSYASEIKISLTAKNNLVLEISDDGVGLPEGYDTTGNGIRNMEMRAKRMNGKLDIKSGKGVTITLTL